MYKLHHLHFACLENVQGMRSKVSKWMREGIENATQLTDTASKFVM